MPVGAGVCLDGSWSVDWSVAACPTMGEAGAGFLRAALGLVILAAGCCGQCRLPEHPSNGRHSPVESYCPPHEWHVPRCQSVPGTSVPDGWLLSVKCDDGFVLNTLETSYSQSSCAEGRWLPPLASCVYSYTNDKHKCVAPPFPRNGKYDPLPIECAVNDKDTEDLILPGAFVPSMCVLYYSCNEGYERADEDVISICERGQWNPNNVVCKQSNKVITKTNRPPNSSNQGGGGGGCALPTDRDHRNFCSYDCVDCVRGACSYEPGSRVADYVIKVQCDSGYRSLNNQDYSTMVCINGSWSQDFPQCQKLCPPLISDSLFPRCLFGASTVDCDKSMLPGTSATYKCKDSHREYPGLASVYRRTNYCKKDGSWTYPLPECKPVCGVSIEGAIIPQVVDGRETQLGAFPWHTGLYRRDATGWNCICGGSLVTNRIILTAAHCVYQMKPPDLKVALGKLYRAWSREEPSAIKRNVSRIRVPSEYQGGLTTYTWDIALLLMSESVELNSYVMPVCRDTSLSFDLNRNNIGYVVGWGKTLPNGYESDVLLFNDLQIMSKENCFRNISQLSILLFDKFCGAKNAVSIAEKGDSGGGLTTVFNKLHYVVGIVSVKYKNYSVFTNVSWDSHKRWIDYEISYLNTF